MKRFFALIVVMLIGPVSSGPLFAEAPVILKAPSRSGILAPSAPATPAFDFSLTSGGPMTLGPSTTGVTMITAAVKKGSPQEIVLATSELPRGVEASLSKVKCLPTCFSNLTITTEPSVPPGNYPITVSAGTGSVSRSTLFILTITAPVSIGPTVSSTSINPDAPVQTHSQPLTVPPQTPVTGQPTQPQNAASQPQVPVTTPQGILPNTASQVPASNPVISLSMSPPPVVDATPAPTTPELVVAASTAPSTSASGSDSLGGPIAPRKNSPHWDHIRVMDFGRNIGYLKTVTPSLYTNAVVNWYATHVDLIEPQNTQYLDLTAINPTMQFQQYIVFHEEDSVTHLGFNGDAVLPETAFLHFAEDTTGTNEGTPFSIPGCPSGPVQKSCRVKIIHCGGNPNYFFYPADSSWRSWMATKLLNTLSGSAYVYLDCTNVPFAANVVISTGGKVREYGTDLNSAYSSGGHTCSGVIDPTGTPVQAGPYLRDMCQFWQGFYAAHPTAKGKFLATPSSYINQLWTQMWVFPMGSVNLEGLAGPGVWGDGYRTYFLDVLKKIVANGGLVEVDGIFSQGGTDTIAPPGVNWSKGNYQSAQGRYRMYKLANYYIYKEPVGSPGVVYYNATLNFPFGGAEANTDALTQTNCVSKAQACQFPLAAQVDVGQPTQASYEYVETGFNGRASSYSNGFSGPSPQKYGGDCLGGPHWVLFRRYTKALAMIRPLDGWPCMDWGDGTGLVITLDKPRVILYEDGTHSAPVTQVTIRMGEGLILGNP